MGFHSHELGGYLRDDLSFPSDFALYFSVACVFLMFGFVLLFFQ